MSAPAASASGGGGSADLLGLGLDGGAVNGNGVEAPTDNLKK
jgi:hypothetical protein